ncbi:hypothetical protein ACIRYZ_44065 [Kitasatospora sp. NPDC101155]|uniref:hypothetical protein n=1 Tax=Kitasatospora sp. NPDC101155 TaxID=3364097 RepID=UPI003828E9B6
MPDRHLLPDHRFGNVPINGRIKQWAATAPPPDHAGILHRWELYNDARTLTAVAAFTVLTLRKTTAHPTAENAAEDVLISAAGPAPSA